jgi:very-short-patch-repair endonuclease
MTTLSRSRKLRRQLTPSESVLWWRLRAGRFDGFKFRRQHPMGPYIVDFYCAQQRLVVEVDGDSHFTREGRAHDERRARFLASCNVRVLRFDNHQVRDQLPDVLDAIHRALSARP